MDAYQRSIVKPVDSTVRIAVDGMELSLSSDFSINTATGAVLLSSPPTVGQVITAGYEFDVPVRFVDDDLRISVSNFSAGDVPSIPLVELIV